MDRNRLDEALDKFFMPELETRTVLVIHHDTLWLKNMQRKV
ncbi:MAG: hypothetical protein R2879_13270 [Saprospiraceae bacterium]